MKRRLRFRGCRSGCLVRIHRRLGNPPVPSILLADMQSLENKLEELRSRLSYQRDIKNCYITESCLNDDMDNIQLAGFSCIRQTATSGSHRGRYDKCMQAIRDDIELKYKETLRENRRKTVHLEKDKDRVQGYRQAIASQRQQLMEECRRLSQEQESLTGEKNPLLQTGGARALFHMALEREREWHRGAVAALREVKEGLVERQEAFYSILVPWEKSLEMEKDVLVRAGREQALNQLDVPEDGHTLER